MSTPTTMRRYAGPLLLALVISGCVTSKDVGSRDDDGEDVRSSASALDTSPGQVFANSTEALSTALSPTAPVGAVAADFQVDTKGAGTYSIPIQVPPGIQGLQPKLSLTYSSSAGNGIAGVGLSVTGIPMITRCAKLLPSGLPDAVRGDSGDAFCLDGQRLVLDDSSNAAYGADGAIYRTELTSWSKITSSGNCGGGPCYFTVRTKDGTLIELGGNPDARAAGPNLTARTWMASKITSLDANYMVYHYTSFGDGQIYPDSITYALNGAAQGAHVRWVKFEYEARSDVEPGYLNGTSWTTSKRLAHIKTWVNGAGDLMVRDYRLTYITSPNSYRSLIDTVSECDGAGVCLPATQFQWQLDKGLKFHDVWPAGTAFQHDLKKEMSNIIPGDYNGDGKTDFIRQAVGYGESVNSGVFRVYFSKGDGTFDIAEPQGKEYQYDLKYDEGCFILPGDFDGDGRTDFIRQEHGGWDDDQSETFRVYFSKGDGTFNVVTPNSADYQNAFRFDPGAHIILGDVNGDGKTDLFRQEHGGWDDDSTFTFGVYLSNGDGTFQIVYPALPPSANSIFDIQYDLKYDDGAYIIPGDYNGDGRTDFIRQEHGAWDDDTAKNFSVFLSRGDGTFDIAYPQGNQYQSVLRSDPGVLIYTGDFNGDGKTDFLRQEHNTWDDDDIGTFAVYFSRGDGTFDIVCPSGPSYDSLLKGDFTNLFVLDYNGDGRSDFLRQEKGAWDDDVFGTFQIYVSKGDGTFEILEPPDYVYQDLMRADPGAIIIPGDYDGDGRWDFIRQDTGYWDDDDTNTFSVYFANGARGGDLLTKATDGYGSTLDVQYAPLSDASVHARDNIAVPGTSEFQVPMYVVKAYQRTDRADVPNSGLGPDQDSHAFFYKGARTTHDGHGFVGFSSIQDKNVGTGTITETRYNQAFPLAGSPSQITVTFADGSKTTTTRTYADSPLAYAGVFNAPLLAKEEVLREAGGQSFKTVTRYEYDLRGNPVLVHHDGLDGYDGDDYDTCTTYTPFFFGADSFMGLLPNYPVETVTSPSCGMTLSFGMGLCNCAGPTLADEKRVYSTDLRMKMLSSSVWDGDNGVWLTTTFAYDAFGNTLSRVTPAGATETMTYEAVDPAMPATKTLSGAGAPTLTTSFAYDPRFGELVTTTDPSGAKSARWFDGLGRLSKTTATDPGNPNGPLKATASYLYDYGFPASHLYPFRQKWTRQQWQFEDWTFETEFYDGFGRVYQRFGWGPGWSGVYRDTDYDQKSGLVAMESLPYYGGAPRDATYKAHDAQGRLAQITDPMGRVTKMDYAIDRSCPGCVAKITTTEAYGTALQRSWSRYVDAQDHTLKRVDADNHVTTEAYDRLGRETSATDAAGTTTITYDTLGRIRTTASLDRGTFTSTYGANGLLASTTDARGQNIHFYYDGLGRLAEKLVDGVETIWYSYDTDGQGFSKGRLTHASVAPVDASKDWSVVWFSYSADGLPQATTAIIDGHTYTLLASYDPLGRNRSVTFPGNSVLTRTYDLAGNAATVSMDGTDYAKFDGYSAAGQPGTLTYANGLVTTYAYDKDGELVSNVVKDPQNQDPTYKGLQNYAYTWSSRGQITQIQDGVDATHTQSFTYSATDQLTQATGVYGTLTYGYDAAGNLTLNEGVTQSYWGHRLANTGNGMALAYDAAGNRVTKAAGGSTWSYQYDGQGRLQQVAKDGATTGSFAYRFDGERVVKNDANGNKTLYVSPDFEVTILPNAHQLWTKYVSGPAGRVAAVTTDVGVNASLLLPYQSEMETRHLYDTRSLAGLLGYAGACLSAWRVHPQAPLYGGLLLTFALALSLTALSGRPRVRRALGAVATFYHRIWGSRFDTRFARRHRFYAGIVPLVVASMLAGCQPAHDSQGGGEDVAQTEEALTAGANGAGYPVAGTYYFHHNHLGSSSLITAVDRSVIARAEYKPFGAIYQQASPGQDIFRAKFTGKEWDGSSELYYFNSRYYDPATGQFLSTDTFLHGGEGRAPASLDPYAYALNNPVVYVDPSGHFPWLIVLVAAAIGAWLAASSVSGSYNPGKWDWTSWKLWTAITVGAAAGGLSGGIGASEMAGAEVASAFVDSVAQQGLLFLSDDGNTVDGFFKNVAIGTAKGAAFGAAAGKLKSPSAAKSQWKEVGWEIVETGADVGLDIAKEELSERLTARESTPPPDQTRSRYADVSGPRAIPGAASAPAARAQGPAAQGQSRPIELRPGSAGTDRMASALIRTGGGLRPIETPIDPALGHDARTWAKAALAP